MTCHLRTHCQHLAAADVQLAQLREALRLAQVAAASERQRADAARGECQALRGELARLRTGRGTATATIPRRFLKVT